MAQRHGRGRAAPAPGQFALFDEAELLPRPALPAAWAGLPEGPHQDGLVIGPCLYGSPARGLAGRIGEFDLWKEAYGNFGSLSRSHAWTSHSTGLWQGVEGFQLDRCEPTILSCDLRRFRDTDPIPPCGHDGKLLYRAVCRGRGCTWEGPERERENPAAEDGLDHSWPGWRDLPTVPEMPYMDGSVTSGANQKKIATWLAQVNAAYPAGWVESGGPIRTVREPPGNRHVDGRTPWGGYDVAVSSKAAPA